MYICPPPSIYEQVSHIWLAQTFSEHTCTVSSWTWNCITRWRSTKSLGKSPCHILINVASQCGANAVCHHSPHSCGCIDLAGAARHAVWLCSGFLCKLSPQPYYNTWKTHSRVDTCVLSASLCQHNFWKLLYLSGICMSSVFKATISFSFSFA